MRLWCPSRTVAVPAQTRYRCAIRSHGHDRDRSAGATALGFHGFKRGRSMPAAWQSASTMAEKSWLPNPLARAAPKASRVRNLWRCRLPRPRFTRMRKPGSFGHYCVVTDQSRHHLIKAAGTCVIRARLSGSGFEPSRPYPASQPVQRQDWSARGKPVTPAKKNVPGATPAKKSRA